MNPYLTFPGSNHRRSEGGATTGGPREALSQEVRGRQYDGGSRATGGPPGDLTRQVHTVGPSLTR